VQVHGIIELKGEFSMSHWKDEDIATPELISEYLQEFKDGIYSNPACQLDNSEKAEVEEALAATRQFCLELLVGKKRKLYMHDLILMTIGYYGGYLSALDAHAKTGYINPDSFAHNSP
jgi:hypothetical protein